ncbi:hypothetical protein CYMTET_27377, partial [Cymbomonas tetramitiformis]
MPWKFKCLQVPVPCGLSSTASDGTRVKANTFLPSSLPKAILPSCSFSGGNLRISVIKYFKRSVYSIGIYACARTFHASTELEEAVKCFQEDGAVCLRKAFDDTWIEAIAHGIDRNMAEPSRYGEWLHDGVESSGPAFFDDYMNWKRIPEFEQYVRNSGVAELARALMQSSTAVFYHEHVLVKEAGTSKLTPWHQDQPYYPVDGRHLISVWFPVDPVAESESLRFIKGSHNWGRWFTPRKFASQKPYTMCNSDAEASRYELLDVSQLEEEEMLSWGCEPGDCENPH